MLRGKFLRRLGLVVFFSLLATSAQSQEPIPSAPSEPDDPGSEAWSAREAAHFLRRAGFGGTPTEVEAFTHMGRRIAIDTVLDFGSDTRALNSQLAQLQLDLTQRDGIQRWWIARMLYTSHPLEERMTLFWHNHFATALSKVSRPDLMLQQNQTLRSLATSRFRDLLLAVAKDPAMLILLDNRLNRRGNPNENFARELMELFTIGIGNYTEQDVHEVARAFTGWTLTRDGLFTFNASQHDSGAKTILVHTGNFDGTDVIDILASHPATARRLSRQLWEFFAYPNPDDAIVDQLAQVYLSTNGDIRSVVRAILESPEFYSERAFHALVKSPVDLVIETLRSGLGSANLAALPGTLRRMGQELFNPPNVGGWPGGLFWIGTATMLERLNFVNQAIGSRTGPMTANALRDTLLAAAAQDAPAVVDYWLDRMVNGEFPPAMRSVLVNYLGGSSFKLDPRTVDGKVRGLIYLVAASPNFQLY